MSSSSSSSSSKCQLVRLGLLELVVIALATGATQLGKPAEIRNAVADDDDARPASASLSVGSGYDFPTAHAGPIAIIETLGHNKQQRQQRELEPVLLSGQRLIRNLRRYGAPLDNSETNPRTRRAAQPAEEPNSADYSEGEDAPEGRHLLKHRRRPYRPHKPSAGILSGCRKYCGFGGGILGNAGGYGYGGGRPPLFGGGGGYYGPGGFGRPQGPFAVASSGGGYPGYNQGAGFFGGGPRPYAQASTFNLGPFQATFGLANGR